MLIGVIADDFTGASDIANTLVKGVAATGGLRTAQYSGVPTTQASADIEAGVIALKSRTAPIDEAVQDSLLALDWLRGQQCRQIVFKYCSTFDSTPQGNIGPVAEALATALSASTVLVCPSFPAAGRTVYQGHLFVFDKLLSESGMEKHPLTPMPDSDIRRWLSLQTTVAVEHLPLAMLHDGTAAARSFLDGLPQREPGFVVADAASEEDLLRLAEVFADAPFLTGGSGIAMGLPKNVIEAGLACGGGTVSRTVEGPGAVLAGSCSGATRGQVDHHAKSNPVFAIDVSGVMKGDVSADSLVAFIEANRDAAPLVYSSGTPSEVADVQSRFGREAVAERLDNLFAVTARRLLDLGYRRIVVAGGETSGAVAKAITAHAGTEAMDIGSEIDPGVPILFLRSSDPIALALKSGNFGGPDFFSKALHMMAHP